MAAWERWDIIPYESVGPVRVGMVRDELWRLFGEPAHPHLDTGRDVFVVDNAHVLCEYTDGRVVQHAAVVCGSALRVCFEGVPLHGSLAKIAERLEARGFQLLADNMFFDSFEVPGTGVGMWVPDERRSPKTSGAELIVQEGWPEGYERMVTPWAEALDTKLRRAMPHSKKWQ